MDDELYQDHLLDDLLFDEIERIHTEWVMDEADREDRLYVAIDSATDEELGFEPEVDYDAESCMPIPHKPHADYPYPSCPGFIGPEIERFSEEYQAKLEESEREY